MPPRASMRLCIERLTRWSDEDNHGVVNNAVYLTLFEEARHAYFVGLGLLRDNRFPFLLAQTNVVFLHPGRGGARLQVEVSTTALGRTSITQAYRVLEGDTGAVLAEAEARLVTIDAASGSKVPLPEGLRRAVREFEGWAP